MRTGHLDFDSGKWVDDPEQDNAPPPSDPRHGHVAVKVNGETRHLRYFETKPPTVADKARSIKRQRKGE